MSHLLCYGCGYDLYQREDAAACPECGHPVSDSIAARLAAASRVPFSLHDVGWIERVGFPLVGGTMMWLLALPLVHPPHPLPVHIVGCVAGVWISIIMGVYAARPRLLLDPMAAMIAGRGLLVATAGLFLHLIWLYLDPPLRVSELTVLIGAAVPLLAVTAAIWIHHRWSGTRKEVSLGLLYATLCIVVLSQLLLLFEYEMALLLTGGSCLAYQLLVPLTMWTRIQRSQHSRRGHFSGPNSANPAHSVY